MDRRKPQIIAIIAGPGVGKTFLTQKLEKGLGAEVIVENYFPEEIIDNLKNEKNHLETLFWFKQKLIKEINKAHLLKKQGKTVILDTFWASCDIHIPAYTKGFMEKTLLKYSKTIGKHLPKPDKIIYLDASEETIIKNVKSRNRDFDTNKKNIDRILKIKRQHDNYYLENIDKIFYVNRDNLDFERKEDLELIKKLIANPKNTP